MTRDEVRRATEHIKELRAQLLRAIPPPVEDERGTGMVGGVLRDAIRALVEIRDALDYLTRCDAECEQKDLYEARLKALDERDQRMG